MFAVKKRPIIHSPHAGLDQHGMTRDAIIQLFTRLNEAANRHDAEAVAQLYAEDSVVQSPMAGGAVTGRKAHAAVLNALFSGIPNVRFHVDELLIDGNRVAQVGSFRGTDTNNFMGLPSTGKPFNLPIVILSTVDDGLIVHERRIYDFTGFLVQIGLLKAKPV
jgi:steroid delta-isomerase-like uncharacterized protein